MTYLLGLDISTTSAKALLIDAEGKTIASHSTPQPISQPYPLWSEQNPSDWWDGIVQSIRAVISQINDPQSIKAIGLTGQMHGLVCLDDDGDVLRPAILWNDQRTRVQCDWITQTIGEARLLELTGNRALAGFTAPKIIWLREHEPQIYRKIAHILLPKDYLRFKLTGEYAIDLADASGTLLLNVRSRSWSDEVLEALTIPHEWLPKAYEGTEITGYVSEVATRLTGLPKGIPVVGGGGDQAAQAVGVGAIQPGIVALTVGTSGVVFAPLAEYAYERSLHAFCHALPNQYHLMGVMLSAAGSFQWYRDTFAPHLSFDELIQEATTTPIGADGLIFLPYLTGERTPHPDPLARGAFIGLTSRHTRAHLTRAVLEGITFGLRDSFELIKAVSPILEIRVSGGGAKSLFWLQMMADVFGTPLTPVENLEGAAYGAALLAGMGTGIFSAVQIATETPVVPVSKGYEPVYLIYRSLYPTLKYTFQQLETS